MELIKSIDSVISEYQKWVVVHPRAVHEIESAIKYLSYVFTSKWNSDLENSNLVSELIYTLSKLLVFCNDQIIYKANVKDAPNPYENKLKKYLTILEHCEVFIELSAHKVWGNYGKWLMIFIVQTLKSVIRLILLLYNKEQIVEVHPISPLDRKNIHKINLTGVQPSDTVSLKTGRVIRTIEGASTSNRDWKSANFFSALKEDRILTRFQKNAEILYIMKPLVHLGSMYVCGTQSWKPWMISFLMDIASLRLMTQDDVPSGKQRFSPRQRSEITRRTLSLFMYLMRSPFYDTKTKETIYIVLSNVSRLPLLGLFVKSLNEYVPQWQRTYFYLWSS